MPRRISPRLVISRRISQAELEAHHDDVMRVTPSRRSRQRRAHARPRRAHTPQASPWQAHRPSSCQCACMVKAGRGVVGEFNQAPARRRRSRSSRPTASLGQGVSACGQEGSREPSGGTLSDRGHFDRAGALALLVRESVRAACGLAHVHLVLAAAVALCLLAEANLACAAAAGATVLWRRLPVASDAALLEAHAIGTRRG